jgi:hypothetical protein
MDYATGRARIKSSGWGRLWAFACRERQSGAVNGQIRRVGTFQNLVNVPRSRCPPVLQVWSIAQKPPLVHNPSTRI